MSAGASYNVSFVVSAAPEYVAQAYATGLSGTGEYTFTMSGNGTIIVTRPYIPTWAIIVGAIGLLFFLLGVLAFFVRNMETLTISLTSDANGTRVAIAGVASQTLI